MNRNRIHSIYIESYSDRIIRIVRKMRPSTEGRLAAGEKIPTIL